MAAGWAPLAAALLPPLLAHRAAAAECVGLPAVPRFDGRLKRVPNDLGKFCPVVVRGDACRAEDEPVCLNPDVARGLGKGRSDEICLGGGFCFSPQSLMDGELASEPTHWRSYVVSVMNWSLLHLIVGFLLLLLDVGLLARCCRSVCRRSPLRKRTRAWTQQDEQEEEELPEAREVKPNKALISLRYILLAAFAVLTAVCVIVAHHHANLGITAASAKLLIEPPAAAMKVIRRLPEPIAERLVPALSDAAAGVAGRVAAAIDPVFNVTTITRALTCSYSLLSGGAGALDMVDRALLDMELIQQRVPEKRMKAKLDWLGREVAGLSENLKITSTRLGSWDRQLRSVKGKVADTKKRISRVIEQARGLDQTAKFVLDSLATIEEQQATLTDIGRLQDVLVAFAGNPGGVRYRFLQKKLIKIREAAAALPDMARVSDAVGQLTRGASAASSALPQLMEDLKGVRKTIEGLPGGDDRGSPGQMVDALNRSAEKMNTALGSLSGDFRSIARINNSLTEVRAKVALLQKGLQNIAADATCVKDALGLIRNDTRPVLPASQTATFEPLEDRVDELAARMTAQASRVNGSADRLDEAIQDVGELPDLAGYAERTGSGSWLEGVDLGALRAQVGKFDRARADGVRQLQDAAGRCKAAQKSAQKRFDARARQHLINAHKAGQALLNQLHGRERVIEAVEQLCNGGSRLRAAAAEGGGLAVERSLAETAQGCERARQELRGQAALSCGEACKLKPRSLRPAAEAVLAMTADLQASLNGLPEPDTFPELGAHRRSVDGFAGAPLGEIGRVLGHKDVVDKLDDLRSSLDVAGLRRQRFETQKSLDSAPRENLTAAQDFLASYQTFIAGPKETKGTLAAFNSSFGAEGVRSRIRRFGLAVAFRAMADAVEDVASFWNFSLAVPAAELNHLSRVLDTLEDKPQADINGARPSSYGGAWHLLYLMSALQDASAPKFNISNCERPLVTGCLDNGALVEYSDGEFCGTRTCLDNTAQYANQGLEVIPGLARERLFAWILLPFVLLAVVGLAAMADCCGATAAVLRGSLLALLPPAFLALAVLVPFALVAGDVCASSGALLANNIDAFLPFLCDSVTDEGSCLFAGLNGSPPSAAAAAAAAANGTGSLALDVRPLLRQAALGESAVAAAAAAAANGSSGAALWEAAAGAVEAEARAELEAYSVQITEEMSEFVSADFLSKVNISGFTDDVAAGLSQTVLSASGIFDARNLHAVYQSVEHPLCCGLVRALRAYVACLALLAAGACCCGFPGGLLAGRRGQKRAPGAREARGQTYDEEGIELANAPPPFMTPRSYGAPRIYQARMWH